MRIQVKFFALARDLAGTAQATMDLPEGATVGQAWDEIIANYPGLARYREEFLVAVNRRFAEADRRLAEGDEVAIIPPVSGGEIASERRRILELRAAPFEPGILEALAGRLATEGDGAVVAFLGRTRVSPGTPAPGQEAEAARHAGRRVLGLEYETHEAMALAVLEAIADEVAERFGVERLAIVHRVGSVPLGEPSVAVVAVAAHRDAAFAAARYAIDETKARAPIWKAEHFADGHVWIGEPAREGPPARPEP